MITHIINVYIMFDDKLKFFNREKENGKTKINIQ